MITFSKWHGKVNAEIGRVWRAEGRTRKEATEKLLADIHAVFSGNVDPVTLLGPNGEVWCLWCNGPSWSYQRNNGQCTAILGTSDRNYAIVQMVNHFLAYYPEDTYPAGSYTEAQRLLAKAKEHLPT